MMHVKVKAKDTHFNIVVPYAMLHVVISIASSTFLQKKLNKWTRAYFEREKIDFAFPPIDKQLLKPIIKEMKNYKGLTLVDIKAKDGTEVKVRL